MISSAAKLVTSFSNSCVRYLYLYFSKVQKNEKYQRSAVNSCSLEAKEYCEESQLPDVLAKEIPDFDDFDDEYNAGLVLVDENQEEENDDEEDD